MKKYIALVLLLTILVLGLSLVSTYADNTTYSKELEKVILVVKEKYDIGQTYDKFKSSVNSFDDQVTFSLNWSSSKDKNIVLDITTDKDGNIISYYKYFENEKVVPGLRIEEAKEIAEEFISKTDGSMLDEIKLEKSKNLDPLSQEFTFNYTRHIKAIPYKENQVTVSVNKYNREVSNYFSKWDKNIATQSNSNIIGKQKAKEIFIEDLGLVPMYKRNYNINMENSNEYYVVYKPRYDKKLVDAKTGSIIELNEPILYRQDESNKKIQSEALTEDEVNEVLKLEKVLSKEEINQYIISLFDIPNNHRSIKYSLDLDYYNKDTYIWTVIYEYSDDKSITVKIDSVTKEILYYYNYDPEYVEKENIVKTNEKDAIGLVGKISQDKLLELEYLKDTNGSNYYFQRKTNGIVVEDNYVDIKLDQRNQKLIYYNSTWYKGKIKEVDKIISLDDAYKILFKDIGYNLEYIKLYDEKNKAKEIKLVYNINSSKPNYIRAEDGVIINHSGQEYYEEKTIAYEDIGKSYAKTKIEILGENGIGFYEREFRPKEKMKEIDFLYMLYQSKNPYKEGQIKESDVIDYFIINDYIAKGDNISNNISKEKAAKYVVIAMGYKEIGSLNNIFSNEYKDAKEIEASYLGYLNIARGFNIISEKDGRISPKKVLSREDGASIIYNYLFR